MTLLMKDGIIYRNILCHDLADWINHLINSISDKSHVVEDLDSFCKWTYHSGPDLTFVDEFYYRYFCEDKLNEKFWIEIYVDDVYSKTIKLQQFNSDFHFMLHGNFDIDKFIGSIKMMEEMERAEQRKVHIY